MIKVEQITIHEFRGIRDLTIDFSQKNFAICGPNGTGKSGVVDALEFVLTGNISRLSGHGTGDITIKDHAPHVDSRTNPENAWVIAKLFIPSLKKSVTVERTVKNPLHPKINPDTPDIISVLNQVSTHPEFTLSRRELIQYVLATPGNRSTAIQALLRIEDVETVRKSLTKISNSSNKEVSILEGIKIAAQNQFLQLLGVDNINHSEKILGVINANREKLGLQAISQLTETTNIKEGLVSSAPPQSKIPKVHAIRDLTVLNDNIFSLNDAEFTQGISALVKELTGLNQTPGIHENVKREKFFEAALSLIESDLCPVCDTVWDPLILKQKIEDKIQVLEEAAKKRKLMQEKLGPISHHLQNLQNSISLVENYIKIISPDYIPVLSNYRTKLSDTIQAMTELLPIQRTVSALENIHAVPKDVTEKLVSIEQVFKGLPEPSEQDSARELLTIGQERYEKFVTASDNLKKAKKQSAVCKQILDTYGTVSTSVLNGVYDHVEKDFSLYYRLINRDDEANFQAQLKPSNGKLAFDVDFYGRGFFPPSAYHSEGHQDGMGICLYLALMQHLLGGSFTFAVLDDVLMSVDVGHRKEVCRLLKEYFPQTQFIITTHDPIWLKFMKTSGLIDSDGHIHFRKWNVDHGPAEWDNLDTWKEIDAELAKGNVQKAASLLRYYLEFIYQDICHHLRAPVEFLMDGQYTLGDVAPAAISRFGKLLRTAKDSANSWNKEPEKNAITLRQQEFDRRKIEAQIEDWQTNPAVHYNAWANFTADEFRTVVDAQRELLSMFLCSNSDCGSLFYVTPPRAADKENLRCICGQTILNLVKKVQVKAIVERGLEQ